jgi:HEAT repeat
MTISGRRTWPFIDHARIARTLWMKAMNDFQYEPVYPLTRDELTSQLESGEPQVVASALHAASKYDEDWKWVQDQCLRFLNSPDVSVRWAAATCLGDLAFLRRPLDVPVVLSALEQALQDSQIADPVNISISMVRQFLGPK